MERSRDFDADQLALSRQAACRTHSHSLVALVARFAVASVFWRSGGFFQIKDNTFYLFREEYKVPLLSPDLAAYMATTAEHVFPVLLILGLASRLSALGLMAMTLVIQLFVYPDGRPDHILWFAPLLLILARGPGAISLDHLVCGVARNTAPWPRARPEISNSRAIDRSMRTRRSSAKSG